MNLPFSYIDPNPKPCIYERIQTQGKRGAYRSAVFLSNTPAGSDVNSFEDRLRLLHDTTDRSWVCAAQAYQCVCV